jgi:hypothetical protein
MYVRGVGFYEELRWAQRTIYTAIAFAMNVEMIAALDVQIEQLHLNISKQSMTKH